jgi:hypothetical protein
MKREVGKRYFYFELFWEFNTNFHDEIYWEKFLRSLRTCALRSI